MEATERIHFARWHLQCDSQATQRIYAAIESGAAERCGCDPCRNFVLARDQHLVYPAQVLSLFDLLGINYRREAEVTYYGRTDSGLHSYAGWFHFIGLIEAGADAKRQVAENAWQVDLEPVGEHFALGFTTRTDLVPDSFKGHPVAQLEFETVLPWVLDTPEAE